MCSTGTWLPGIPYSSQLLHPDFAAAHRQAGAVVVDIRHIEAGAVGHMQGIVAVEDNILVEVDILGCDNLVVAGSYLEVVQVEEHSLW